LFSLQFYTKYEFKMNLCSCKRGPKILIVQIILKFLQKAVAQQSCPLPATSQNFTHVHYGGQAGNAHIYAGRNGSIEMKWLLYLP